MTSQNANTCQLFSSFRFGNPLSALRMLLLLIFSLLSIVHADFASYHVNNYLNQSVAPCENFYRHVCSIEMKVNDSVAIKSENYYKDLAAKLQSRSLNNPVMSDIAEARADLNCSFNADVYSELLNERCSSDFDCHFDEFKYFFNLFNATNKSVDDSLNFYLTHGNKTSGRNIAQARRATSRMVELLYRNSDFNRTKSFNSTVSFYQLLNDRLFLMEVLNANDTADHVGLEKIFELNKQIKEIIMKKFQETTWMIPMNQFGFTILGQYKTIMDELVVLTDFDSYDRNLTTMRAINRDTTLRYLENSQRSTGCIWFDVVHSFNTTTAQMEKDYEKRGYDQEVNYVRAATSLSYNAFNFVEASVIVVLGAAFYPLIDNSTESTMVAFAGDILGHEIYHSFITEALQNRSEEYKSETDCLSAHYNQTCQLFAEGPCNSGEKTLSEDGPDLEGIRAAYELLMKKFTNEELMEFEYTDLQITREQSFFYSVAMRSCRDIANAQYTVHSPDNIRVNALVSQMPEFSRAFGCQSGDVLYADPEEICFLFGEKAKGKKRTNSTLTEVEKRKSGSNGPWEGVDSPDATARLLIAT